MFLCLPFITISAAGHGWKRRVGNYQNLKTDLAVTIQSLTLGWVEAKSLYKTNTVTKVNPIENVCSEVKRTMQGTWPVLPPRNSDEQWALVSDTWDEVASSQRYIRTLIESTTWWMKSVVEAEGLKYSFSFSMRRCNTSLVPVARQTTSLHLLRLWVWISPGAWMSVFCKCCYVASAT